MRETAKIDHQLRLFERSGEPLCVLDDTGHVVTANGACGHLLDRPPAELVGSCLFDWVHPDDLESARARISHLRSAGGDARITCRCGTGPDQWRTVEWSMHIERVDGPAYCVGREVSARPVAELQATTDAREHVIAVVAHELGAPLTAIRGYASLMIRRWDAIPAADKQRHLARMLEQADRVSRLAADLLTVSRADAGTLAARREPFPVMQVIQDAVVGIAGSEVHLDGNVDTVALGDADHTRRIIENLVLNARKYGAPPIMVMVRDGAHGVELVVSDEGPGVPEQYVPSMFEPFTQADLGADGTGLGLSIVASLARAQGGDVRYGRGPTGGAEFTVRLLRGQLVPS